MKKITTLTRLLCIALFVSPVFSYAEVLTFLPSTPKRTDNIRMRVVSATALAYDPNSIQVGMVANKITVTARFRYFTPGVSTGSDPFVLVPFEVDLGRLPAGNYDIELVANRTDNAAATVIERDRLTVTELDSQQSRRPDFNYTDLWWSASESGWGISIHTKNGKLFAAWFVYDSASRPTWYTVQDCLWITPSNCVGGIVVKAIGSPSGGLLGLPGVTASLAGTADITFTAYDTATLNYTVDGISNRKTITRQPF